MSLHFFAKTIGPACALLALAACDQSQQPVGQPMPIEGETVATVNGVAVKEPELQALIDARSSGDQTPSRQEALDELIGMELLRQQAVEDGVHKTPDIKLQINRNATNALISGFVRQLVDSQPVTDEELKAEYEKRFGGAASSEEYKSRHILSESEEDARGHIKALEEGADFAELAKEHSTGPSAGQGGDLGWSSPDNYVPAFSEALQSLEPGEYTQEPVETKFGWHVIQLDDTRQGGGSNFERVKPQLERMIVNQRLQDYVEGLKDDASVDILDSELAESAQAEETEQPAADAGDAQSAGEESAGDSEQSEEADPALQSK